MDDSRYSPESGTLVEESRAPVLRGKGGFPYKICFYGKGLLYSACFIFGRPGMLSRKDGDDF